MRLIFYIVLFVRFPILYAQTPIVQIPDSSDTVQSKSLEHKAPINIAAVDTSDMVQSKSFDFKKPINITAPAAMFGYGLFTIVNKDLHRFNLLLRHEMVELNRDQKAKNYDFLQYIPLEVVYGLNALGIKGKHNFVDRTLIYSLSSLIMSKSVTTLKRVSHQPRPDGSDYRSFPSGHAATAFSTAEFMRLEYKEVSPWYGVVAYTIAGTAGGLRMYDNKHWFSDIVAGAGIGILSTDLAYWAYPKLRALLEKKTRSFRKNNNITLFPSFQEHAIMFSIIYRPN